MHRARCFSTLILALAGLLPAFPAPAGPTLREVVERFDAAQAKLATLQAPFTLTTRRALLKTPTVTKGTLYMQGSDFVHFAFAPPEDLIVRLTPQALVSYSPVAGQGEMLKIRTAKNADRQLLALGQRLSYLSDYFAVALAESKDLDGTYQLTFTPRSLSMKKRMQSLVFWVDKESSLPRQVQWVERSGDSWLFELGPLQANQPIPVAVAGFKVPESVTLRTEFSFFAARKK